MARHRIIVGYDENGRPQYKWVDDPPSKQKTGRGTHPPPGPPSRDPLSPYERGPSNTAADQATQVVLQFLSVMGYPSGLNATKLALAILKNGLYLSPERAYNYLFTQISAKLRTANPNAEFGMTKDAYTTTLNAFKDAFENLTGTPDVPHDVLRMAIDQQWTQSELTRFLQNDSRYSNPAQLPWLQQGTTYRDVKNQFFQSYGHNPTDVGQLANWFNFRVAAQQVGTQQVATQRPGQGPQKGAPSQSEIR